MKYFAALFTCFLLFTSSAHDNKVDKEDVGAIEFACPVLNNVPCRDALGDLNSHLSQMTSCEPLTSASLSNNREIIDGNGTYSFSYPVSITNAQIDVLTEIWEPFLYDLEQHLYNNYGFNTTFIGSGFSAVATQSVKCPRSGEGSKIFTIQFSYSGIEYYCPLC